MINQIFNEDCLEGMKRIPDNFIDLTVTSPPYDNLRTYNGYTFDFEGIAKELYRVTKQGGVVVWVVGDATVDGSETGTSFKQALYFMEIGFNLHDTMIYEKDAQPCHDPRNKRYKQLHEYMFILSNGKPNTYNEIKDVKSKNGGKTIHKSTKRLEDGSMRKYRPIFIGEFQARGTVWKVNTDKRGIGHPAIFPEKLAEDHILSWSNPGDIVLDPFTGSGTTLKMAIANERQYIGFEISKEYAEIARKRISHVQSSLF